MVDGDVLELRGGLRPGDTRVRADGEYLCFQAERGVLWRLST